jgi:hypothetical protein
MSTVLHRFGGLLCMGIGVGGALAVVLTLTAAGAHDVALTQVIHTPPAEGSAGAFEYFAMRTHWASMLVLEGVIAAFVLACTIAALVEVGRSAWREHAFTLLSIVGAVLLAYNIRQIWAMRDLHAPLGYLSQLLSSLPESCHDVRRWIAWARLVGEPVGIAAGVAMTTTVTFARPPTVRDLQGRSRHLRRLLYVVSLLFVAGILMARANFRWVTAHWPVADESVAKAIAEIVEAGVVQSGVGYSAVLALFFVPARLLLHTHVQRVVSDAGLTTAKDRKQWLEDHDLSGRWQDDTRQIVAILAPVLSIPVLDALAKL